jgi:hypothetical protein
MSGVLVLVTGGVGPLRLGPVLEVDTTHPVDISRVAAWVTARLGGQDPGAGPV